MDAFLQAYQVLCAPLIDTKCFKVDVSVLEKAFAVSSSIEAIGFALVVLNESNLCAFLFQTMFVLTKSFLPIVRIKVSNGEMIKSLKEGNDLKTRY